MVSGSLLQRKRNYDQSPFWPMLWKGEIRNEKLEKNIDLKNLIPEIEAVLF
jgi:hypothetical protein